jgi:hypothetical protein
MHFTRWALALTAMVFTGVLAVTVALYAEPPRDAKNDVTTSAQAESTDKPENAKRVSVEVARRRAKLTHSICSAMLDVIHHQYFRHERSTVPAVAMEDAFLRIADQENVSARWITVNAKVMNIDHEPQDEFEQQAAKAIAAGKTEYESVEKGIYRRAQGISLMNKGCLQCHLGFGSSGRIDRFAGLVIAIEVSGDRL